jgi:two-component system response regulator AtoC
MNDEKNAANESASDAPPDSGAPHPDAPPPCRVLVADDEESMRHFLDRSLKRRGFEVETVDSGDAAIERFEARPPDVAVLDLKMPGADGIEVLARMRAADPEALVIIMTAYGTIRSAVEAMRLGAFDYITKPFEIDELLILIERALSQRATLRENRQLRQMVDNRRACGGLIGQSPAMREVFQSIDLLSESSTTVLIEGESGTGKELLAHAIHLNSPRRGGEFVPLYCVALPENLFESELFGHAPGAFTGATKAKRGLIDKAHGGTLFLDEVSEISTASQLKLLRFLQEREFTRLGSTEPVRIDVRIIAATNRDLEAMIEDGTFRKDFYWRLKVVPVRIPPLRERREDIPLLASHFLERFNKESGGGVQGFTLEAMILMTGYAWPGNVRELENAVERLVVLHADKEMIDVEDLPPEVRGQATAGWARTAGTEAGPPVFQEALGNFERLYLVDLLQHTSGNVSQATRISGISRSRLHAKIKQHGIDTGEFRG